MVDVLNISHRLIIFRITLTAVWCWSLFDYYLPQEQNAKDFVMEQDWTWRRRRMVAADRHDLMFWSFKGRMWLSWENNLLCLCLFGPLSQRVSVSVSSSSDDALATFLSEWQTAPSIEPMLPHSKISDTLYLWLRYFPLNYPRVCLTFEQTAFSCSHPSF